MLFVPLSGLREPTEDECDNRITTTSLKKATHCSVIITLIKNTAELHTHELIVWGKGYCRALGGASDSCKLLRQIFQFFSFFSVLPIQAPYWWGAATLLFNHMGFSTLLLEGNMTAQYSPPLFSSFQTVVIVEQKQNMASIRLLVHMQCAVYHMLSLLVSLWSKSLNPN